MVAPNRGVENDSPESINRELEELITSYKDMAKECMENSDKASECPCTKHRDIAKIEMCLAVTLSAGIMALRGDPLALDMISFAAYAVAKKNKNLL